MEGFKPACSDVLSSAASVVQRQAKDAFIQSLRNFDDVFKDAYPTYLSGNFTGNGSFSRPISPLIGKTAQIINCAQNYKRNLSLFHAMGLIVPAPELFTHIKAFTFCLKHCTNPDKWDFFSKLVRLLRDLNTFIKDDRSSPMRSDSYDNGLNEHIGGLTRLVSEDICDAVITREDDIEQHRAHPIPVPDFKTFTSAPDPSIDKLDYIYNTVKRIDGLAASTHDLTVNINNNTAPANPSREAIYRLIDRIKADTSVKIGKKRSIGNAVKYIRYTKTPAPQFENDIIAARNTALAEAKKCADGEEKFWNSIKGEARPSQRNRKPHGHNAPPAAVKILDKGL